MVKRLANKLTKEIMSETQIKEKNMNKGEFTGTWQGRIYVLDSVKSGIAKKVNIEKEGEYAIKVR